MPLQNRVTPFGDLIATPERGTFFGNRGVLHDAEGRLRRAWQVKRWLICLLEFRGRRRPLLAPQRYTALFFLDEATALAAGHRPCAECRHERFTAFCAAWQAGNRRLTGTDRLTAAALDERLHAERVAPDGSKRSFRTGLADLPAGVFVRLDGFEERAFLVQSECLREWSPGGYGPPRPRPRRLRVAVLTPRSTVEAIRAGYAPELYPSAGLG